MIVRRPCLNLTHLQICCMVHAVTITASRDLRRYLMRDVPDGAVRVRPGEVDRTPRSRHRQRLYRVGPLHERDCLTRRRANLLRLPTHLNRPLDPIPAQPMSTSENLSWKQRQPVACLLSKESMADPIRLYVNQVKQGCISHRHDERSRFQMSRAVQTPGPRTYLLAWRCRVATSTSATAESDGVRSAVPRRRVTHFAILRSDLPLCSSSAAWCPACPSCPDIALHP